MGTVLFVVHILLLFLSYNYICSCFSTLTVPFLLRRLLDVVVHIFLLITPESHGYGKEVVLSFPAILFFFQTLRVMSAHFTTKEDTASYTVISYASQIA